jgi:hypothetical protein
MRGKNFGSSFFGSFSLSEFDPGVSNQITEWLWKYQIGGV